VAKKFAPVCVSLGSNLGDRAEHIVRALINIAEIPKTRLLRRSHVIETAPVGPPGQGPYLNAVAILRTSLTPRELLDHLLRIEREAGRVRDPETRWGPRELDLDILLFADQLTDEPDLTIPHPRMHERGFVLTPLAQVEPDALHPLLNKTAAQLLAGLRNNL
jgi:2-amino-4-hydroxy-6-hydroxymethyldihydropteridine diphosphokinase